MVKYHSPNRRSCRRCKYCWRNRAVAVTVLCYKKQTHGPILSPPTWTAGDPAPLNETSEYKGAELLLASCPAHGPHPSTQLLRGTQVDEGAATGRDPKEDHELLKNKNLRRRRRRPGRHSAKTIPLQHHQVMEEGVVLFYD